MPQRSVTQISALILPLSPGSSTKLLCQTVGSQCSESVTTVCDGLTTQPVGCQFFDTPPLRARVPCPWIWVGLWLFWPTDYVESDTMWLLRLSLKPMQLPQDWLGYLFSELKQPRKTSTLRPCRTQSQLRPSFTQPHPGTWHVGQISPAFCVFPAEAPRTIPAVPVGITNPQNLWAR